jgi:hypothetical protein
MVWNKEGRGEISGTHGGEYRIATVLWNVASCCLVAVVIEAARTSETYVNLYQTTRRNIPVDSRLQGKTWLWTVN